MPMFFPLPMALPLGLPLGLPLPMSMAAFFATLWHDDPMTIPASTGMLLCGAKGFLGHRNDLNPDAIRHPHQLGKSGGRGENPKHQPVFFSPPYSPYPLSVIG